MGNLETEGRDVSLKAVYFNQQHHFERDKYFAYRKKTSIDKLTKQERTQRKNRHDIPIKKPQ